MYRVQALTVGAIATLATLMGWKMPPTVRLGAARTVVELGIHQHDAETILKRLEELEATHRQPETARRGGNAGVAESDLVLEELLEILDRGRLENAPESFSRGSQPTRQHVLSTHG
jgi:hypothetical protein